MYNINKSYISIQNSSDEFKMAEFGRDFPSIEVLGVSLVMV